MTYSEELFTYLVEKYGNMVYRICYLRLHNLHDAEDVCQEVFEKLFVHLLQSDYFQSEEHVKSWLITVSSNAGISKLREAYNRKRADLDDQIPFYENEFEKKDLLDCIMRLDKKYSTVIYLFYFERLTIAEIAKSLKIPQSTVKTRLKRGREALKVMLGNGE
ncbi:MAG: sigma-70 family RNA polymerase sigma factor [Clostridiales bacterium]|jgi:RNA polymerase sigma-70 factor (ECF subfamily)|nr:sigma-70 family RNA polymerase sigma factor [Clostridiales bacterium]